ncbi:MAG: dienelactone hydrolase family protein [Bacteroidales bacterium]
MPKRQKNRLVRRWFAWGAIPFFSVLFIVLLSSFEVIREKTVTFPSADSLLITADEYVVSEGLPYVVLFHEQGSSRGEFKTIARRLCKMDYNCLAVDIRNGGTRGFVSNETAKRCREQRCPTDREDIEKDMNAAIRFAFFKSDLPVILFGSGVNASLSLKLAAESELVKAVVALSPGEYFLPDISIHDTISNLSKPVFITSSQSEFPYMEQLVSGMDERYVTLFKPELGEGSRGTGSLTSENEHNSEYWLALLLFFKDLI